MRMCIYLTSGLSYAQLSSIHATHASSCTNNAAQSAHAYPHLSYTQMRPLDHTPNRKKTRAHLNLFPDNNELNRRFHFVLIAGVSSMLIPASPPIPTPYLHLLHRDHRDLIRYHEPLAGYTPSSPSLRLVHFQVRGSWCSRMDRRWVRTSVLVC